MKGLNCLVLCVLVLPLIVSAAPGSRPRRDASGLDPTAAETQTGDLNREKRKLPEAKFQAKNAVLGFVFGKINSLIDAKTRFIDTLDHQNIEKNKQLHIESPKPITSFQDVISGVITPKITAITSKIGSLSGAFLGGSSGGGSNGHDGNGGSGGGLGGIVSSLLRLSGPILTSSSGAGGGSTDHGNGVDEDDDFKDDFN